MNNLFLKWMLMSICVLSIPTFGLAADKPVLVIPEKLTLHDRVELPNNVIDGCNPDKNMSYIFRGEMRKLKKVYSKLMLQPPSDGRDFHTLNMEIVDIFGLGGGAFSGSKRLVVKGELLDRNGKQLGSFYCYRASIGNALSLGLQGTCQIYMKIYTKMMKDIIKWVKNPSMNAFLGEKGKAEIAQGNVLEYERKQAK